LCQIAEAAEFDISVTTANVDPISSIKPAKASVRWIGGFEIHADSEKFGGFSGLTTSRDGRRLFAVTDRGGWMTAEFIYDDDQKLIGLQNATLGRLKDLNGRDLLTREETDAESLDFAPDGSIFVAFEYQHRIRRYPHGVDDAPLPSDGGQIPIRGSRNRGIEALVAFNSDRIFAIVEGSSRPTDTRAFILVNGAWQILSYSRDNNFRPSGAARLPSGDVLVLERAFSKVTGFRSRIRRIRTENLQPGAHLIPEEVLSFGLGAALMNFEGLAAHEGPNGVVRLTLISDNNFSSFVPNVIIMIEISD
jgi:hypothetical protein